MYHYFHMHFRSGRRIRMHVLQYNLRDRQKPRLFLRLKKDPFGALRRATPEDAASRRPDLPCRVTVS